jgi:hypothetical protein
MSVSMFRTQNRWLKKSGAGDPGRLVFDEPSTPTAPCENICCVSGYVSFWFPHAAGQKKSIITTNKNGDPFEPPHSLHQSCNDCRDTKEALSNINLDIQSDARSHFHSPRATPAQPVRVA